MIKLTIECEKGDDLAAITGFLGGQSRSHIPCGHQNTAFSLGDPSIIKGIIKGIIDGAIHAMTGDLEELLAAQNVAMNDPDPAPSQDVIEPAAGCPMDTDPDSAPVMADPEPAPAITIHDLEDVFRRINSAEGLGINKSREILNSSGVKRVKEIPEAHWAVVLETALVELQSAGAK